MNRSVQWVVGILSTYAGLLGITHGLFEIMQGGTKVTGMLIEAVGPPCQADAVWHACLPAMTLLPTMRIAGIMTILIGLAILVWGMIKRGRPVVLICLAVGLLLSGGGFVAVALTLVAGGLATQVNRPLTLNTRPIGQFAGRLWPFTAVAYVCWIITLILLNLRFNDAMMRLTLVTPLLSNLLLFLMVLSALAAEES